MRAARRFRTRDLVDERGGEQRVEPEPAGAAIAGATVGAALVADFGEIGVNHMIEAGGAHAARGASDVPNGN
jgi:hypothetical protein